MQYFCIKHTFCFFSTAENHRHNDIVYMLNVVSFTTGWISDSLILNLYIVIIIALFIHPEHVMLMSSRYVHMLWLLYCVKKVYVYNDVMLQGNLNETMGMSMLIIHVHLIVLQGPFAQ